jgi:hypothetical protein
MNITQEGNWIDFKRWCKENGKQVYRCMVCGKLYAEGNLPIIDKGIEKGDGCCRIGSLIEVKDD